MTTESRVTRRFTTVPSEPEQLDLFPSTIGDGSKPSATKSLVSILLQFPPLVQSAYVSLCQAHGLKSQGDFVYGPVHMTQELTPSLPATTWDSSTDSGLAQDLLMRDYSLRKQAIMQDLEASLRHNKRVLERYFGGK